MVTSAARNNLYPFTSWGRIYSYVPESMKRLQNIAIGCALGLLVFLVFGSVYRVGRHAVTENDELVVLGSPTSVRWTSVAPLPSGRGFVSNPPLISTAPMDKGDKPSLTAQHTAMHSNGADVRFVSMNSNDVASIDIKLASREVENRFGTTVLAWQCRARGAVAREGNEYYLFIEPTGGGDAGYTVLFDTEIAPSGFKLRITERLWRNSSRQCELWFRVRNDGTIQNVDAL